MRGRSAAPRPVLGRLQQVLGVVLDVAAVEHRVLGGPDVDEGRLHAREHVLDPPDVDVAVDLGHVVRGPADVVLDEVAALEHGDLDQLRADVDAHQVATDRAAVALTAPAALQHVGVEGHRPGRDDPWPGRRQVRLVLRRRLVLSPAVDAAAPEDPGSAPSAGGRATRSEPGDRPGRSGGRRERGGCRRSGACGRARARRPPDPGHGPRPGRSGSSSGSTGARRHRLDPLAPNPPDSTRRSTAGLTSGASRPSMASPASVLGPVLETILVAEPRPRRRLIAVRGRRRPGRHASLVLRAEPPASAARRRGRPVGAVSPAPASAPAGRPQAPGRGVDRTRRVRAAGASRG